MPACHPPGRAGRRPQEPMENADQSPISENLVPGSAKLYLFFGGIVGAIGMPPFEFYRASGILGHSRIFLRDLEQAWYQRGLPAMGDDARAIGDYLERKIRESGAQEVYLVGNSMGGYAALLFCAMLQQGKVIAFAPQTFVSPEKRRLHEDTRWARQIDRLHGTRAASDIHDLKEWIRDRHPQLHASIYVSSEDALDMRHAGELADFPNIRIHCFPEAGHNLVARLRDDGLLAQILNS
jgi:pimeloyl-ACP methyl ester carboxylesterase